MTLDFGPEESLSLEAHVAMIGTSGNLSSLVSFSSRSPVSSTTPYDTSHLLVYGTSSTHYVVTTYVSLSLLLLRPPVPSRILCPTSYLLLYSSLVTSLLTI